MAVLDCVKPGVKSGQVMLAVDLTVAGITADVLETIQQLGYDPTILHVAYSRGVHVLVVLKNEQHDAPMDEDYLIEEWIQVRSHINPDAVHLWRGK